MKNIKYIALAIIGIASVEIANAQGNAPLLSGGVQGYVPRISFDGGKTIRNIGGVQREVEGSPFINEKWTKGVVYFVNGQSGEADKLNYDAIDKVLVTQRDGQEMLYSQPIKEFILKDGTKDRKFRKMNDNFYEVLYDGNTKLLKLHTKAIIETASYGSAQPINKIGDEAIFYVVGPNNTFEQVKNDKALLAAVSAKQEAVKKYVKDSSLNLKKESDMVKLLTYYDSL